MEKTFTDFKANLQKKQGQNQPIKIEMIDNLSIAKFQTINKNKNSYIQEKSVIQSLCIAKFNFSPLQNTNICHKLESNDWIVFLIYNSTPIAYCYGYIYNDTVKIQMVEVDPDYYNLGICTFIIKYAISFVNDEIFNNHKTFSLDNVGGEAGCICYVRAFQSYDYKITDNETNNSNVSQKNDFCTNYNNPESLQYKEYGHTITFTPSSNSINVGGLPLLNRLS